jgi:exopolysaccharide biosynthesis protein
MKVPAQLAVSWLLLALLTACGKEPPPRQEKVQRPEKRPPRIQIADPDELAQPRQPSEVTQTDSQGLAYKNERVRQGPWSINLLLIDRSRTSLELATTLGGKGKILGLSKLTEQVKSFPADLGQPVAAVNGDFYRTEHHRYAGDPRGLQIMNGELVSAPTGKTCFWIDANDEPRMGEVVSHLKVTWPDGETTAIGLNEERRSNRAVLYTPTLGSSTRTSGGVELVLARDGPGEWLPLRPGVTCNASVQEVRQEGNTKLHRNTMVLSLGPTLAAKLPVIDQGMKLQVSTLTSPDLAGVRMAIGGGPALVKGGKAQPISENRSNERHPRTAVGWSQSHIYFIQVDGRQQGFSVGMTLPELASYLAKQGCQEAMNLDGGGSSEMWIEGRIVNRPCYGHERNTANALLVVNKDLALGQ